MSHITDNIFLGDRNDANDIKFITKNNINIIFNITKDIPNYFSSKIQYYNFKIEDSIEENIYNIFEEITNLINNINSKSNILIHCREGKSRSATCVIAYLIKYKNISLYDAFNLTKNKRNIIQPNIQFFNCLIKWELNIHNKSSITIYEYMGKTEDEYNEFINKKEKYKTCNFCTYDNIINNKLCEICNSILQ